MANATASTIKASVEIADYVLLWVNGTSGLTWTTSTLTNDFNVLNRSELNDRDMSCLSADFDAFDNPADEDDDKCHEKYMNILQWRAPKEKRLSFKTSSELIRTSIRSQKVAGHLKCDTEQMEDFVLALHNVSPAKTQSLMTIPIVVEDRVVCVIQALNSRARDKFTDEDEQSIRVIATILQNYFLAKKTQSSRECDLMESLERAQSHSSSLTWVNAASRNLTQLLMQETMTPRAWSLEERLDSLAEFLATHFKTAGARVLPIEGSKICYARHWSVEVLSDDLMDSVSGQLMVRKGN